MIQCRGERRFGETTTGVTRVMAKLIAVLYERNESKYTLEEGLVRFTLDLESEGLKAHVIPATPKVAAKAATKTRKASSGRKAYPERYIYYVNVKSEIGKLRQTVGRNIYVKVADAEGVSHLTMNISSEGITFGEVEKDEPEAPKGSKGSKSSNEDFEMVILKKLIAKGDEPALVAFFQEAKGYDLKKSRIMAGAICG